jgi:hypothetical protein
MRLLRYTGFLIAVSVVLMTGWLSACAAPSEVTVHNQTPVIESIDYIHDTFATSEVLIECSARDVDSDNLTYEWKAGAGRISGSGPTVTWMPPENMGIYPVTLVVSDGRGGVASENISIRVVTNADGTATPIIEVRLKLGDAEPVKVDKQRVRIWMTADILCKVENADGSDLTYTWSATGGKIQGAGLDVGKADKVRWTAPGQRGEAAVNVKVSDSRGREATGRVDIEIFCCGN